MGPEGTQLLSQVGMFSSVTGALVGAIGSFYAAESQKYQAKSAALSAEFEASMANLNARSAELDAQHILEAGQREVGLMTLRAGQAKASSAASMAAGGVQAGVGSAAEVQASIEAAKQIDALGANSNAVMAANAARMRSVDWRNKAMMGRLSAANLRATAGSIRPWMSATSSLLGSAGAVAGQWLQNQRWEAWASAQKG